MDTDQSVRAAGRYLVQLLPGAPDSVIDTLEQNIAQAGPVTALLDGGLSPEDMLRRVLHGMEVEILETTEVEYRCYCSRRRVEATLISLGRKELTDIVREGENIEISCQFCDTIYKFTSEEIGEILKEI